MFARLVTLDALSEDESPNRLWINVARTGEWKGHPRGPFQFTGEIFDQIIANAERRQTPINCDYEHQTFKPYVTGAVPSSGHILKLERRGDELWALVELTPRAAQHVRAGEYRSCSPVIEFDSKDRASGDDVGPEMLSLALTNDPFQDGLAPYRLTRSDAMSDLTDEEKKKAAAAAHVTAAEKKEEAVAAPTVMSAEEMPKKPVECADTVALADPPAHQVADSASETAAAADYSAEGDDVDADAVFGAIADAAGAGKAEVLAAIADNIDAFVGLIQDSLSKGDQPAKGEAKAMSRLVDHGKDIRALSIELKQSSAQVTALSERLAAAEAQLKATREKAAQEKAEALLKHCLSLQASGHVGPEKQDLDDAVYMFSQDYERASRAYSRQIVPVGKPDSEDERNNKAGGGPVTLDNLSDKEKQTVQFMIRAGVAQDAALATIGEKRAGKGN